MVTLGGWFVAAFMAGLLFGLPFALYVLKYNKNDKALQVRNARAELQTVMERIGESSPLAIFIADIDGVICDWFESASILFGWDREEAVGKNISMLVPFEKIAEHLEAFKHMVETQQGQAIGMDMAVRVYEGSALNRSGSELPVKITLRSWLSHTNLFFSAEVKLR